MISTNYEGGHVSVGLARLNILTLRNIDESIQATRENEPSLCNSLTGGQKRLTPTVVSMAINMAMYMFACGRGCPERTKCDLCNRTFSSRGSCETTTVAARARRESFPKRNQLQVVFVQIARKLSSHLPHVLPHRREAND